MKKIMRVVLSMGALLVGASEQARAQPGNVAHIEQTGNANVVTIEQAGSANWAHTYQNGSENWILVEQATAISSQVTVQQQGHPNVAETLQTALAGWTTASLGQNGDRNVAKVAQTSTTGNGVADLYQEGQDNDARIVQSASGDNQLDVRQWGGSVGTPGHGNLAWLFQDAGTINIAVLEQIGNDNRFVGADSLGGIAYLERACQYAMTGGSELHLYQEGSSNTAGLHQWAATGNYADIRQLNEGNQVGIYQTAYQGANYVRVYQTGRDAGGVATVSQIALTGNNTATVTN